MRSRILPLIGVGAVAVAIATSYSLPASAHGVNVGTSAHSVTSATHTASEAPCYAQLTNDGGNAIVSQNFTDSGGSLDAYDSQAADDFTLTKTCKFSDVQFFGTYFNGSGPADSFNVTFYKDNGKSAPGKVQKKLGGQNLKYKVSKTDGSFTVDFGKKDKTLKPGTYWVSVQANMAFSSGGEFGWNTNTTIAGDAGMWENPGNGFSTGCTSYGDTGTCLGLGTSVDYAFAILK